MLWKVLLLFLLLMPQVSNATKSFVRLFQLLSGNALLNLIEYLIVFNSVLIRDFARGSRRRQRSWFSKQHNRGQPG